MTKYFLSFVEEFWPGQIGDTWIGRMEYHEISKEGVFAEEISIGTDDRAAVEKLRDRYDFKTVRKHTFQRLLKQIKKINRRYF